ncbi:T9SS type B sorting domain-containing protein [Mangrovimonas spongiae]|nr:T9SS type B sorting domain-containing protein [Mangrovimonas spongiae]
MKKIIALFILLFSVLSYGQGPGCPNVQAGGVSTGGDVVLDCGDSCVDLSATFLETGETTSYEVSSIPYNPPTAYQGLSNPIFVGSDDIWSDVVDLPFEFCFFGDVYDQLVLGANGLISFDTSLAGGFNAWAFDDQLPSNTDDPLSNGNIFGACHDIYPPVSPPEAEIAWEVRGTYPCRTFVISFYHQAQFSCTDLLTTQMMVLYEGTNAIEVYIENKPICDGWNDGNAVIGIQNNAGTVAYVPPGRNTGAWQPPELIPGTGIRVEGWRFTPNGTPNYQLTWYDEGGTPLGNDPTINVCPTTDTFYTAEVEYTNCNGDVFSDSDIVNVTFGGTPPTVTLTSNGSVCTGGDAVFTITGTPGDIVDYNINGGATQQITLDASGEGVVTISGITADQTINLLAVNNPGNGCSATLTDTNTVTITATPTVTLTSNNSTCSGGDAVFTITGTPGDIVDYSLNGGATQQVTLDASGEGIVTVTGVTTDQTINLLAVNNPTTTCSDTLSDTATVTITANPTVTLSTNTDICSGDDAIFTIVGSPGDVVDYNINGGATQQVTLDAAGQGNVTVTGATTDQTINLLEVNNPTSGCGDTLSNTETVVINREPAVTLSTNTDICSGDDAIFTITGTAGDIVDYNINGGTTQQITLDASGQGVVTVTGVTTDQIINLQLVTDPVTSCSVTLNDTETVTVIANPTVTLSTNTDICSGDDAIFTLVGSAGDIVDYSLNSGATQQVTLDASGQATVTTVGATVDQNIELQAINNPGTGCSSVLTDTAVILVNPNPSVTLTSNGSTCSGSDAVFTITGNSGDIVDYTINGGATQQITLDASGQGIVLISGVTVDQVIVLELVTTPSTSCNTVLTDTETVVIESTPSVGLTTNSDICSGEDAIFTITGSPGDIVDYNLNGGTTQQITLDASGQGVITVPAATSDETINLELVNNPSTGCNGTLTDTETVIVNPNPTVTLSSNGSICPNDDAEFTITGSPGDIVDYNLNGGATQQVTIDASGQGIVTVAGATTDQTITLELVANPTTTCSTTLANTETVTILTPPTITSLSTNSDICSGDDAIFTITGTPGDIVDYNVNGGATEQVTLDATTGEGLVTIVGATTDQTITLELVTNPTTTCSTVLTNTDIVTVIENPTATVTSNGDICFNEDASFTITGDPDNVVDYNVNGGATQQVTLDAAGEALITLPGATVDQVLTLEQVVNPTTTCSTVLTEEATVVVNPLPTVVDPTALIVCDDNISDGMTEMDLTVKDNEITAGNSSYNVTYYNSLAEAQAGTPEVAPSSMAYIGSDGEVVHVRVEDATTGCVNFTTLTLNVVSAPAANTPSDLHYCDPDNDGLGVFDLSAVAAEVTTDPALEVTFHLTEQNAIDDVLPQGNVLSNVMGQIIYVRVDYAGTSTDCPTIVELNLIVDPTPEIEEDLDPIVMCDDDGTADGLTEFDLTIRNVDVLNGLSNTDYTVTYYEDPADADIGTTAATYIATPAAYTNTTPDMQTIGVRVENNTTGCYTATTLDLIVNPLPVPETTNEALFLTICDDTVDNDGYGIFDLTQQDDIITGGNTNWSVDYYETMADLQAGNTISDYTAYANTSINGLPHNPQTLFVLVTIGATGCSATSTLTIEVLDVPTPTPSANITPLEACDEDNDGYAEFDLQSATIEIDNGEGNDITYHGTYENAEDGVNELPDLYTNNDAGTDIVYVRATDPVTLCYTVVELQLIALPTPEVLTDIAPYSECDDDYDGITSFDLTTMDATIYNGQNPADYTLTYHETLADAEAIPGVDPIVEPQLSNYMSSDATIYVRLEGANGCIATGQFDIIVNLPPTIALQDGLFEICDDSIDNDGYASFDLTTMNGEITGNDSTLVVDYYETMADVESGNSIPDYTDYTNISVGGLPHNPQTIFVTVTETSSGNNCYAVTTLTLVVNTLPTPNDNLPDLEACDDNNPGDLEEVFDLTENEPLMLNAFDETATYYTSLEDAEAGVNAIATPDAYQSAAQTIYVRVTNTGDPADPSDTGTGCYTIVTFNLIVNPLPETTAVEDIIACEVNTDGYYTFDLTIRTDDILNGQPQPDYEVHYYETLAAAESGTGWITNDTAYTNIEDPANAGTPLNPQEIYVSITNTITGCSVATVSFFIEVQEGAMANIVPTFEMCDDNMEFDGDPSNDTVAFDLTIQDATVLGTTQSPTDFTVTYYESEADALDMMNALSSPYTNISNPQTIWVRVDNDMTADNDCYDITSFELQVNPIPSFTLDNEYTLCVDANGTEVINTPILDTGLSDTLYTFEWTEAGDPSTVLGTGSSYEPVIGGVYTVYVEDIATQCTSTVTTTVIESGPPALTATVTTEAFADPHAVVATVTGEGEYEFSLDNGPWVSNGTNTYTFTDVAFGEYTVRARDINGCGISYDDVFVVDYPLYFTPNDDGFNDTWQIVGIQDQLDAKIYIFDRYGKLLKQLSPSGPGWDGTFNGEVLPSSDYWFTIEYREPGEVNGPAKEFRAHFSLKR